MPLWLPMQLDFIDQKYTVWSSIESMFWKVLLCELRLQLTDFTRHLMKFHLRWSPPFIHDVYYPPLLFILQSWRSGAFLGPVRKNLHVSTCAATHIKIGKQQHTQRFGSSDIQGTTETLDSPLRLKSVVDFNGSMAEHFGKSHPRDSVIFKVLEAG